MKKLFLYICVFSLLLAPYYAYGAFNDVSLGISQYSFSTADTWAPALIQSSAGGQVETISVGANYIDITLFFSDVEGIPIFRENGIKIGHLSDFFVDYELRFRDVLHILGPFLKSYTDPPHPAAHPPQS